MFKRLVAWFRWHAYSEPRTINEARVLLAARGEVANLLRYTAHRLNVDPVDIESYAESIMRSVVYSDQALTPAEYMSIYEQVAMHLDEDAQNGSLTADKVLLAARTNRCEGS